MPEQSTDLSRLHDVVLPAPVSWWPLAPGWWALLALVLVVGAVLAARALRRRRADAYRRAALRELEAADSPTAIATLLRRTALAAADRREVAGLYGDAWVDWLAARSPAPLPEAARAPLSGAIYDDAAAAELEPLRSFATRWIREHRPC